VRTTFPDGSFLAYAYDDAQRLVSIADSLGNRIDYTLDAMGNRTREEVRDPAGALAQARTREYSNLNRLAREIGAAGQVTQYAYDPQGNLPAHRPHRPAQPHDELRPQRAGRARLTCPHQTRPWPGSNCRGRAAPPLPCRQHCLTAADSCRPSRPS
jgi:YD repeat-containing protein